ncbi:MAG: hypothetical protein OEZ55_14640, partial [Nitrospinota bacterium]|nr:hypothetical protein [Nitrospinota bacterium]
TSELSRNHFTLVDTAAEASAAAFYLSQTSGNFNATSGLSVYHTSAPTTPAAYNQYGAFYQMQSQSGGTVNNTGALYGFRSNVYHQADSNLSSAYALYLNFGTYDGGADSTGTLDNLYGIFMNAQKTASSTITTAHGIRMMGLAATTVYGLRVGSTTCTTCWDIYAENANAKNWFAGYVGIGTAPGAVLHPLEVRKDGAGYQTVLALENLQTAAADVGPLVMFEGGSNIDMGSIQTGWNGAATTDAYIAISTRGSGAVTERVRVTSDGKVGINTNAPTHSLDVNANTIRVRTARTPASASEACNTGEQTWDSGFVYVCVATNTWKRAALSTW